MKATCSFAASCSFLACLGLAIAAASAPSSADAPFWTAICRGEADANYTQTAGGGGVFNVGDNSGNYVTWPVKQTFYKPDEIVCGAVPGSAAFAQVCADNVRQVIVLKQRDPKHPKAPLKAWDYCRALVKIH